MKAYLKSLAQSAATRTSEKQPMAAEKPEPFERRKACADSHRAEAATSEEGVAYSQDKAQQANPPTISAEDRHACATPHHAPTRHSTRLESSRLNCARGVWRYAAGYWFL